MNREKLFTNIQYDLRDNFSANEAPPSSSVGFEKYSEIEHVLERILSTEEQDHLFEASSELEYGRYLARIAAGDAEDGTRHVHDFILDKGEQGIRLLFVDPEHQLGKNKNRQTLFLPRKGDLRPEVCNLIGVQIKPDFSTPKVVILRYRTDAIEDKKKLKLAAQEEVLEEVLRKGELPEFLQEHENEIIFALQVTDNVVSAQSRYSSQSELEDLLSGEQSSLAVEGKITSFKAVIKRFQKLLEEGSFKSVS